MPRHIILYILFSLFFLFGGYSGVAAQTLPRMRTMSYDDFNDGAAGVLRIVRDSKGMIWFGTQDGLYRFDGYEFYNFKSHAGDGLDMGTSCIGGLYSSSEGSLWCLIDDRVFLFDLHSYRYIDVLARLEHEQQRRFKVDRLRSLSCGITWAFTYDGTIIAIDDKYPDTSARIIVESDDLERIDAACDAKGRSWILTATNTYFYADGQLNRLNQPFSRVVSCGQYVWLLASNGQLYCIPPDSHTPTPLSSSPVTKAIVTLSSNRLALLTDSGVWLLSADGTRLQSTDVTWPVLKMIEDSNGRLWFLGQDNRLCTTDSNGRHLNRVEDVEMSDFNIHVDRYGTQWFFSKNGDTYYATTQQPNRLHRYHTDQQLSNISNTIKDGQGGCWLISDKRACRMTFYLPSYSRLNLNADSQGRGLAWVAINENENENLSGILLVGTRYDQMVTLFSPDGTVQGYLTPDGRVSTQPVSFGASVYCIFRDSHGTLWMGTKSDGIFRLQPSNVRLPLMQGSSDNSQLFTVTHITKENSSLPDNEVYDFAEDGQGHLWIATHRGGLACIDNNREPIDNNREPINILSSGNGLDCWEHDFPTGINTLLVTRQGHLLVGTSNGLFVTDMPLTSRFVRHVREANRANSLSSNDIVHIVQTSDDHIFISTVSGGINEITNPADVMSSTLGFTHYDRTTGFPSDVVGKMAEYDGSLWATIPDRLIEFPLSSPSAVNSFLVNENLDFTTSVPANLGNGKWVFGTEGGAVMIDLKDLGHSTFVPPLVVTGVSVENKPMDFTVSATDTILLAPGEKSLTLWFAALDFEDTEHVVYAYRMGASGNSWINLGQNRSIALPQLQPGTYRIDIRSTNSDGVWTDNLHTITIIVKPTFWQTPWAVLLIAFIVLAVIAITAYTLLYIRRIKRQQHETMEKYLALMEENRSEANNDTNETSFRQEPPPASIPADDSDDPFMQQFVAFIEKSLGNSDVTIDDIANACAVSRTGLHRKVKHMLGMSPMEFLREARLRKANTLLATSSKNVSEIAYECGFSDPKYFSKCFKQATGKTPTEVRSEK